MSVSLLELNQPAKALPYLQKMVAAQPDHVESRGMLANVLLSVDRPLDAAIHFRKLTTLTPDDPKAWYGLGRSYEGVARNSFETLDKTAQGSAEWLALVADSRMERRQYRSAFFFYKQALEKKPDLPGVHRAIAEIYRQSEHADWAPLEERKESKPDCLRNKQACDFAAGRFIEAVAGPSPYWKAKAANELALAAFKKLGTLSASVELHAIKAEILSSHQQYLEAAQEWEAARSMAPRDPQIAKQLAIALYQSADYAKSIPMLSEQVKQDPSLSFFLGDALLKSEKAEQAIPWLAAVVRGDPSFAPARASLGLAYVRTGSDQKAIEHLSAALASDEDGSLHYQLAQSYQRTGAREKAAEVLAKYQEIRSKLEAGQKSVEEQAVITAPSQ
jgi:predicted Zn-dependent protease